VQVVVLDYVGHGLQIDGVPCLVPVDLPAIQPHSLQRTALAQFARDQPDWRCVFKNQALYSEMQAANGGNAFRRQKGRQSDGY
jgi:hypothetical protein